MSKLPYAMVATAAIMLASQAAAKIEVTEWMYNGNADEFIELTNMGNAPIDMTGWRYDDDSRNFAAGLDLSAFGTVAIGQSVIISERSADLFRSGWTLAPSVRIIGNNSINLGRADEINVFDSQGTLVERFTYGDVAFPGTPRTVSVSGNPGSAAAVVPSTVTSDWVLSSVGDSFGSYASLDGDIGNPGVYVFAPVPEPETYALMIAGLALVGTMVRRRAGSQR